MQALGRRGAIRPSQEEAPAAAMDGPKRPGRVATEGKLSPVVKTTPSKRTIKVKAAKPKKPKVKTVAKAKAVLKRAEAKAKVKKPGPPIRVGQPWKAAGVAKSTYYRNLKEGAGK